MFVDTNCPGCHRKLRVSQEFAGQSARCPVCNTIYSVPDAAALSADSDPSDRWRLKTPEGMEYGPVSRTVLNSWVAEGRVSQDCQLRCDAEDGWRNADALFPVLRPAPITPIRDLVRGPETDDILRSPYPGRRLLVNPDRGGIILALGIVSWAVGCPVFGILAWVMGSSDLAEMETGRMDGRGRNLTFAGRMIGMLHVIVTAVALVIGVACLLVWGILR